MTTHRWLAISAVFTAGLLSAGCGSSEDPIDDSPKYPDLGSFCTAKAAAECTVPVVEGCQTEYNDANAEKCQISRRSICVQSQPVGTSYRPSEAEKCLAAVAAAYQDTKYTAAEKVAEAEACGLLFNGKGTDGTICTQDYHCDLANGLRCITKAGESEGTCHVPDEKEPAERCDAVDAVCPDNYFCSQTEKYCLKAGQEGESCSETTPCGTDLLCSESGMCQAKYSTNEACTVDSECQSDICWTISGESQCLAFLQFYAADPICDDFR